MCKYTLCTGPMAGAGGDDDDDYHKGGGEPASNKIEPVSGVDSALAVDTVHDIEAVGDDHHGVGATVDSVLVERSNDASHEFETARSVPVDNLDDAPN
jgi:hypothetical protein